MSQSYLNDSLICKQVIAVLLDRLGGNVSIYQADLDKTEYTTLVENHEPESLILALKQKVMQ